MKKGIPPSYRRAAPRPTATPRHPLEMVFGSVVFVTGEDFVRHARYWRALGTAITPSALAIALGAFAVIDGIPHVYVG